MPFKIREREKPSTIKNKNKKINTQSKMNGYKSAKSRKQVTIIRERERGRECAVSS